MLNPCFFRAFPECVSLPCAHRSACSNRFAFPPPILASPPPGCLPELPGIIHVNSTTSTLVVHDVDVGSNLVRKFRGRPFASKANFGKLGEP